MTGHLLAEVYEPGTKPWLQAMTASKIAAVVGMSSHDTPHSLWHAMVGTTPRPAQTRAQTRGHVYEPLIRGWVQELNPQWTIETTGTWQHDNHAWMLASPDGLIHDADGLMALLEIKTSRNFWQDWRDGVPDHYQAQCQWQMAVTGVRQTIVAACGPDELMDMKPAMYELDADPAVQEWLIREGRSFMESIDLGIEPPADYRVEHDRNVLRWKHTEIVDDPGVVIPDDIAVPFLTALDMQGRAEADRNEWQSRLLDFLGDSKKATWSGATLGTRRKGRGDSPPSFSTAPKLAERAADLLEPTTRKAAS